MLPRNNCLELDGVCSCSTCMLSSGNFRFQSVSLFRTFSCIVHTVAIDCTKLCVAFRFNLINIDFFFMMFLPPSFHFYFSRFRITGMGLAESHWFFKGAKFRKFFGFT